MFDNHTNHTLDVGTPLTRLDADSPAVLAMVDMAIKGLDSPNTQRVYRADINDFLYWYSSSGLRGLNKAALSAFKEEMIQTGRGQTAINRALCAVRKFLREAADNNLITEQEAESAAKVKGISRPGASTGNWLTLQETQALIHAPNIEKVKGKRDRAMLALLVGCGLRRAELCGLNVEHIQQREGRWAIVDMRGKRNKLRTIPMSAWVKAALDAWTNAAGIESGAIFLQVTRGHIKPMGGKTGTMHRQVVTRSPTPQTTPESVRRAVQRYGAMVGHPELRPHDLRRTFAKLSRAAGAPLEQIQINLGHDSLDTTRRYLGAQIDYMNAPSDMIRIEL